MKKRYILVWTSLSSPRRWSGRYRTACRRRSQYRQGAARRRYAEPLHTRQGSLHRGHPRLAPVRLHHPDHPAAGAGSAQDSHVLCVRRTGGRRHAFRGAVRQAQAQGPCVLRACLAARARQIHEGIRDPSYFAGGADGGGRRAAAASLARTVHDAASPRAISRRPMATKRNFNAGDHVRKRRAPTEMLKRVSQQSRAQLVASLNAPFAVDRRFPALTHVDRAVKIQLLAVKRSNNFLPFAVSQIGRVDHEGPPVQPLSGGGRCAGSVAGRRRIWRRRRVLLGRHSDGAELCRGVRSTVSASHRAGPRIAAYGFMIRERAAFPLRLLATRKTFPFQLYRTPRRSWSGPSDTAENSIATIRRKLTVALARTFARCPCGQAVRPKPHYRESP